MILRVPPDTVSAIRHVIREKPDHAVYIYVGSEVDSGWSNACAIQSETPHLYIALVDDPSGLEEWSAGHSDFAGIIFGFGTEPYRYLTQAEADDRAIVERALDEAILVR